MNEHMSIGARSDATLIRGSAASEEITINGTYHCTLVGPDGKVKWEDTCDNVVTTNGKAAILDYALGPVSNYQAVNYLGLISNVSYTVDPAAANTISSHTGWYEAGDGTYLPTWDSPGTNTRAAVTFSAASGGTKALSTAASFHFTADGTVRGCFVVFGNANSSPPTSTRNNTSGTLLSAGAFSTAPSGRAVGNGDTLNISYQITIG